MADNIRKRPIKITEADHINANNLERNFRHFENQLRIIDRRRIEKQPLIQEGATDAETISNLLNAINTIIQQLNTSGLTND